MLILIAAIACNVSQEAPGMRYTRVDVPIEGVRSRVAVFDVTGDGAPDLLVATGSDLIILAGDGRGAFEARRSVPAGENPVDIAIADFDQDGRADIALANHDTEYLTLLLGSGDGDFEPAPWSPLRIDVSPHPHAVLARDVNEDGRIDLVVDHRRGEGLLVLEGQGDGTFSSSGVIAVGGDPYRGMWLDDVNADGHVDVIAPIESEIAVRLGDGRGAFDEARSVSLDGLRPFTVRTLDWNRDGHVDIAAGSGEGQTGLAVLLGDGSGRFRNAPGSPYAAGRGPKELAVADLDADGWQDLLVTAWDAPVVTVLFGNEGGPTIQHIDVGTNPFGVATEDLNGDGVLDIVTVNQGDSTLTLLLSNPR